jgi:transketolase
VRNTFIETLIELAAEDKRIFLLCGDLGFSVLEKFASQFPDRFINIGVAEQNMTGIAAGLALSGKIVFTYSIANFPVMRCLEQIRNDVCYHQANVKIVAVGGGYAYGPQGYTHHGIEDLGVMLLMPNMTVVAPGDPVETRLATRALVNRPGPGYLRLGKTRETIVHKTEPHFELGRAIRLRDGKDLTIISTGAVLELVAEAAERLAKAGINPRVLSMPSLSPLDDEAIKKAEQETGAILTVEEHDRGGLATLMREACVPESTRLAESLRCSCPPFSVAGSQNFLRAQAGLTVEQIVQHSTALLRRKEGLKNA